MDTPTPSLDRESRIHQSNFLLPQTNIGIAFRATVRLYLTQSSLDYTTNIAWSLRRHEFLRITGKSINTGPVGCRVQICNDFLLCKRPEGPDESFFIGETFVPRICNPEAFCHTFSRFAIEHLKKRLT